MVRPLWKTVWQFLEKLNIKLPYDPAIPKELKRGTQTGTYMPVFIAALFMIAKKWKQLKCPSMNEWINTMWSIYTMEYHCLKKE